MIVKDIMQKPVFVGLNFSKKELMRIVKKHPQMRVFVVVNKKGKFLGDVHEDDLFYMILPNEEYETIGVDLAFDLQKKFFAKKVKEIMRKHDICCHENDTILQASLQLAGVEINEIPVLNSKEIVVGVVTQGMLLRHLDEI